MHVLETLPVAPDMPVDSSLTASSSFQSPPAVSGPSSGPLISLAAAGPSVTWPSSAARPTPSSTYTPMAAAGPVTSAGPSPALAEAGDNSPVTGEMMEWSMKEDATSINEGQARSQTGPADRTASGSSAAAA